MSVECVGFFLICGEQSVVFPQWWDTKVFSALESHKVPESFGVFIKTITNDVVDISL